MENSKEGGRDQSSGKKKSLLVGPWGGNGGSTWDDGVFNGVREITIVYDHCIDSIKVVYDKNGKAVATEKHGGVGGTKRTEIKLQYPEEYLVSASGNYCPVVYGGSPVIRSITFKSNRRTFGPFGIEEGTPFTLSMDGRRVVGFTGRSGWYLDAIGFRLSPSQSTKLLKKFQKGIQRLTSSVARSPASKKDTEKPDY
ncbi:jacalin-related lectin 19 [Ricinus communis]|uniref:jacalin-related lectin 19 n=1 Tax=Ricinus communis TaxID=3988 RepID=UPI00077257DC|nr:jacalin-related lectin 19 [Ricinus communis]|eukprot:XP_015572833.1 jacalin-related lectin 19 [Ricinus communis]